MIKTMLKYFKPHIRLFVLDMICAVFASGVELMFPTVSRYAMYDLLPYKKFSAFFTLMIIVAVFYILRSLAYYIMSYWGHIFGVRVEADIREDLFKHLQTLDFEFYDYTRTGTLMSRMTSDLFDITELAHHGPEDLVISSLTIIGALILMYRIEWRLALVVSVLLPIFIIVVMSQRRNMGRTSMNVKKKIADINTSIESSLSGIRTSKAFANEDIDFERFDESNNEYRIAKKNFYKAMGTFNSSMEFFMGIMPVSVIAVGGYLIIRGQLNYIDLITFTLYVNSFINPVRKLSNFAETFANGIAGVSRFNEVMNIKPTIKERDDARELSVPYGKVDVDHVCFSYKNGREILHDINLHVDGGETIAVVGASGGGKTTFCQLLPRFYDVTYGSIKIDGTDIRDITKESLRNRIGTVQQDVFIFADTIMENIRYGRPGATNQDVKEAAKRAEIYDDIMDMSEGFDTSVGERGVRLSGGQKQRISIARIFLKNPSILILDEATSALDTITEERIQSSFDELMKGRTSFVIAHRLATVKNADRIIVIEDGEITENGTHDELLKKDGEYAKLYHTQQLFSER